MPSTHSARIDALRGVAILAVLQMHLLWKSQAYEFLGAPDWMREILGLGWAGVDLFFVLSAYLLTANLLRRRGEAGAVPAFYLRRACRILPMYLLAILAGFALEALWRAGGGSQQTWLWGDRYPLSTYLLFLQNWRIGLDDQFAAQFFAPTWSLAVEEHFYLVLPLIVTFLAPRRLALLAFAWIATAVPIRMALFDGVGHLAPAIWTIGRLDSFGWGMLIALAPGLWPQIVQRAPPRLAAPAGAAVFFAAMYLCANFLPGGLKNSAAVIAFTAFSAAMIAFGVAPADGPERASNGFASALAWCGERCFSLYLLHMPAIGLVFLAAGRLRPQVSSLADLGLVAIALAIVFLAADVCYRRIERPFIEWGARRTSTKAAAALAAAA